MAKPPLVDAVGFKAAQKAFTQSVMAGSLQTQAQAAKAQATSARPAPRPGAQRAPHKPWLLAKDPARKAELLANMAEDAAPLLEAMNPERRPMVEHRLDMFSQSARRSLDIGSVFYMSALLYPDDHKPGEPNTLETSLAELERVVDYFRSHVAPRAGRTVGGEPEPQPEFGVVLEQRIRPGGPAPVRVGRPGGGGQIRAVP